MIKLGSFSKTFNIFGGQVVVYQHFCNDDEKETYEIVIRANIVEGADVCVTLSYKSLQKRDLAYHDFDESSAERFINGFETVV